VTDLVYHPGAMVEDLALNECVVRPATNGTARWWHLWFYVARETDGVPEVFEVPVNPTVAGMSTGPGGKTWGLTCSSPGIWQISPSIKVLNDEGARKYVAGGEVTGKDLWHQTPRIVNVPPNEPWANGAAP
jgi:hypothetical protein